LITDAVRVESFAAASRRGVLIVLGVIARCACALISACTGSASRPYNHCPTAFRYARRKVVR
jgi:hypothetical protein